MKNPLKEHAHLFCTGNFKVQVATGEKEHQILRPRKIIGVQRKLRDWIITETLESNKEGSFEIEYCTLIARPISDMTDEETYSLPIIERIFNGVTEANSPSQIQYYLINKANSGTLLFEDAKALLGLGVLPFPQTLFDDGTVIKP